MVAAQSDQFWLGICGVRERWEAGAEFEVGGGHLVQRECVVEGGDGDVAAVEDGVGACIGV